MKAVILLGGPLHPSRPLRRWVAGADLCVAADGGARHALALGRLPDLWIGDFDSSPPWLQRALKGVSKEAHPKAKDATDGALAVEAARKAGATTLLLAGALGGEADHALAHQLMALELAKRGIRVVLTDGRAWAWPLRPPGLALDLTPKSRISLVPLSDLEGVSLFGTEWTLEHARIPRGTTRTLRNVARSRVFIRLERGEAMVVAWPAPPWSPSFSS